MKREKQRQQTILIVDDSEMNRSILVDILGDNYIIIEAENGIQAVSILQKHGTEISLVLLDIVMPEMDGFGVLEIMNKQHLIEAIPVIIISAESHSSRVDQAYELGVTDFISRPFDAQVVNRRVVNTILLYAKQKNLETLVAEQIYEKEQRSGLMVDILSHIVEFRNGESGLHVLHVRTLTELLLKKLVSKTSKYNVSQIDISVISTAAALHDIGKISIDEKILNKPGRLTDEEFVIMKKHTLIGAKMLENLPFHQDEPLVRVSYEICRWHHERYDRRGYPDGLKGDDIPISAQIVSIADVYDALTSERVYKKAFSHETAIKMILNNECGTFNPMLIECLTDIADTLPTELQKSNSNKINYKELENITNEISLHKDMSASHRTLQLIEHERMKYSFFALMSEEIQFEYTLSPPMVSFNSWGASKLGLDEIIMNPTENEKVLKCIGREELFDISEGIKKTSNENPTVTYETKLICNGEPRWFKIILRSTWSSDEPPKYTGTIGKAIDIHNTKTSLETLKRMASYDPLTELLNTASAKKQIEELLKNRPEGNFALGIIDLDFFKSANDNYGHIFGNHVLIHVAEKLRQSVRSGDIAARIGGDEFLIFLEYKNELEPIIQRIFMSLSGDMYRGFPISISMGISQTETVNADYESLFRTADHALYAVKNSGRGHFCFYNESIKSLSTPQNNNEK